MNIGFLFPGQGSQHAGMLHDLVFDPVVEETMQEVSSAVGFDVGTIDTAKALASTVSVQLALLTSGVSVARALIRHGVRPMVVAGLSVGAFAAAVITESVSLTDAARLVHTRAATMETMFPSGFGLAVIIGLNEARVTRLVADHHAEPDPVFIANINAARQIGLAGSVTGMRHVLDAAIKEGARRAELLPVAVPSHCPLLSPVARLLREQIHSMKIRDPLMPYVANVSARAVRTAEGVAADLANNIAHGVRWDDASQVCSELGGEIFLEMPPGHTLTDLARDSLPSVESRAVTRDAFSRIVSRYSDSMNSGG